MNNCLSALQFVKYFICDDFSFSENSCVRFRCTKSCDLFWAGEKYRPSTFLKIPKNGILRYQISLVNTDERR